MQSSSTAHNFRENDGVVYTKADITETIRHESEMEMEKVARLFHSKQSSIRLIKTKEELTSYMTSNNIKNYLFDCDGVLYRGSDPMPDAPQTIQSLLENGKRVFFVTNNAGSSRSELRDKLEKVLRLPKGTLHEDMMIGSAFVAARYLRSLLIEENKSVPKRVHVIGTSGLCHEIRNAGFDISGGPYASPSGMSREDLASYPFPEGEIDAMVIGLDNDFNYRKLCIATVLLQRNPQAILVATNRDAFDLVGYDARHLP
jgi:HAD superfamily hydrolase (TIGR01450 family)